MVLDEFPGLNDMEIFGMQLDRTSGNESVEIVPCPKEIEERYTAMMRKYRERIIV
ncbi:MAG: hypothetical protein WC548_01525 [Candidatus Pacearchaeota archaeon]